MDQNRQSRLEIRNLTLQYPGKMLCRNLNLTIRPGECWAILGQNGAGKTTLMHALGGLSQMKPGGSSDVALGGKSTRDWPRRELARNIGILLQEEPGEFWGDVHEYVLLGRHPYAGHSFGWQATDHAIADCAIARLDLANLANRSFITLSGGERQRARLALLLAQSPQFYLLDEPLQHLDLRHQLTAMKLFAELARRGDALVMVLHDIGWVSQFCDHVLMLFDDGHLLAGNTQELLNRHNLEALYQCDIMELAAGRLRHFVPATMPSV